MLVVHETPPGVTDTTYVTASAEVTAGQRRSKDFVDDTAVTGLAAEELTAGTVVDGASTTVVVVVGAIVVVVVVGATVVVVVGATVVVVEATPLVPATRLIVPAVPAPTPLIPWTDTV